MSDHPSFELPKASEKLPHKFIFDALRERHLTEPAETAVLIADDTIHDADASRQEPADVEMAHPDVELLTLSGAAPEVASPEDQREPADEELSDDMTASAVEYVPELELPLGKRYFRIGEVSEMIGVEPYVLRYWETEFAMVKPVKSGSGHRVYSRRDVQTLHLIRHLLHVEKFSIKGAKRKLAEKKRLDMSQDTHKRKSQEILRGLAHELRELIQLARANPGDM